MTFPEKASKTQPIRTNFGIRGQAKGWQRSRNWGVGGIGTFLGKMGAGWDKSPEPEFFFGAVIQTTVRELRNGRFSPNLATKRISSMNPDRHFRQFLGSFAPKIWNRKSVKQAPHSEQATGHRMHCRESPRCSTRAREFSRSGQLFCRTCGCGATGRQSCPIFGFWPIFPIQNP